MAFNKFVNFSEAGNAGDRFAEALGVEADQEIELTELMSVLFDKLYRIGAIRNLDGTRAHRRRASSRAADKRRRVASRARASQRARANSMAACRERRRERAQERRRNRVAAQAR